MTDVTIIIPVFNRAEYLPRLFRSLESIDYGHFRVILVDNGSTDNSLLLCHEFASQSQIDVQVLTENRKGATCARNTGLAACQTEWCYFFDSDDEFSPDFLSVVTPLCNGKDVVFMPTRMVVGGHIVTRAYRETCDAGYQILSSMLNTQAMLFRTEWLKGIGGWNESLPIWNDWELGVRVLLSSPRAAWYSGAYFHRIYIHEDSITGGSLSHNVEGKVKSMQAVQKMLVSPSHKKSLYLRACIFEGYLRRENCLAKVDGFDKDISFINKVLGSILRFYVRLGGRGAWKIACWFSC